MPKLKVLDTRQTVEEIVAMSWSPKMDLLALGNNKGCVHLHRLSWQKVWQVALTLKDEPVIPELMTWHPEGLFLSVTSGQTTFLIDVEGGKIVHNHEISSPITSASWCTSQYRHAITEILSAHSRQPHQALRLESNLSILFLGTSSGYIYAYTGGFLLGLCIKITEGTSPLTVLHVDSTTNLESFVFLSDSSSEGSEDVSIIFSNFRNDYLPRMAPVIGPLGLRYMLFFKSWATIQTEFINLNETWTKVVDLCTNYMTFGATKDLEVVRVDFLELLLTGIRSVEMEIFLGSVGREKEAKKNINVITSANTSMKEHIRILKSSLTNMLTELNEIGGFLKHVSGYEKANEIIIEIRKAITYFFLAILNIQCLIHKFIKLTLHFMNLVMNTIHSFNVQELPEFIEEEADTDKVLEFLQIKTEKNLLEYLFANFKIGWDNNPASPDKSMDQYQSAISNFSKSLLDVSGGHKATSNNLNFTNILNPDAAENKYKDFPNFIHELLEKSGNTIKNKSHPLLLDYSHVEAKELVTNIVSRVNSLTKRLLCIPVLCSVPFAPNTFPIMKIPRQDYFIEQKEEVEMSEEDATTNTTAKVKRKPFHLFMNETTSKTYISILITSKKLLMFEVDLCDPKRTLLKCALFYFSRNLQCFEIFSSNHLTAVSYDKDDKRSEHQDTGRTIVCQIPYSSLITRAHNSVDVHHLRSSNKCGVKSTLPFKIPVEIPLNVYKPCAALSSCSNIDYVLPLEGFSPGALNVSGARKVGALLSENRRTILILEMELDNAEESTLDDTGEEEEDGSGSDTSTTED